MTFQKRSSKTTGTEIFKTENIFATASGGNGSSANPDPAFTPHPSNTEKGDGGQATATGVQITHNSVFNHGADTIYVSATGGKAATTEGKGGNAEATGVSVTDSGLMHTYGALEISALGGDGSGNTADRSGSGAATANGLVLTNATTKGSVSSDNPAQSGLSVSATAGDNVDLTNATIGSANATGLQVSGGIAEESINTILVTSTAGENANKFGAAESTGVWVKDEGKLQLTTAAMMIGADAMSFDDNTDGGTATVTAIRGEEKTVVEVIGGPAGLNIMASAKAITNAAGTGTGTSGTAQATAIYGRTNEMSFKTANQDIVIEATTDIASADVTDTTKNHAMAVDADSVQLTFDAGTASLSFTGDVKAINGTVHFYAAGTPTGDPTIPSIGTTISAGTNSSSNGNLDLSGSTIDTTGNILAQTGTLTLSGSTLYFYKNDGKALYDTDYHAIVSNQMADATGGTAELYMRTNSQLDNDLGTGDQLGLLKQNSADQTTYTLHILDEGMKTGYQANEAYTTKQILIQMDTLTSNGATYTAADDIAYDNGVWNYTYMPTVGMSTDGKKLELQTVTTKSVRVGAANLTAADAHAAAAASSIAFTRKKLDTLGQHFGALRQDAEAENGFCVKYLGGRLDVSLHRDTDIDYNGVQVGYDHKAGDGWTVGFAGSYIKGDADYAYGSGDIKDTSFAIYGTQQRADGSYLDLVGQFGKLKNDVTAYSGSLAQRIDSDFDNNVYALSAKYGKRQTKENGSYVEPSFQLVYSNLGSESYSATTRDNVFRVHNDATDSLLLSTGVELGQKLGKRTNAYLRAALQYEFLGDVKTRVTADSRSAFYDESFDGFSLAWGLGIDHQMNETSSLHLDLGRVEGGDLKESWAVNASCRVFF